MDIHRIKIKKSILPVIFTLNPNSATVLSPYVIRVGNKEDVKIFKQHLKAIQDSHVLWPTPARRTFFLHELAHCVDFHRRKWNTPWNVIGAYVPELFKKHHNREIERRAIATADRWVRLSPKEVRMIISYEKNPVTL